MPAAKSAPKKSAPKKAAVTKKVAAKKAVAKKTNEKSETGIKYSDKSAGQEHLIPIFNTLVKLFKPYVKGSIEQRGGKGGQIILVSNKPIEVLGRKRDEMYFAGALVQKGYVGFYFMPAYTNEEFKKVFGKPELLKLLKGKSCFHVKKMDDELTKQISDALKIGYEMYKKKGWID